MKVLLQHPTAISYAAAAYLLLCIGACTQFERNNPYDPNGTAPQTQTLTPVENVRVVSIGYDHIDIAWNAYPDAEKYIVKRYKLFDGQVDRAEEMTTNGFLDHNVQPDSKYFYRVLAILPDGATTPPTEPLEAVTPKLPAIIITNPKGGQSYPVGQPITIEWQINVTSIQAVIIEFSKDNGVTFQQISPSPVDRSKLAMDWTPGSEHTGNACVIAVYPSALPDNPAKTEPFTIQP